MRISDNNGKQVIHVRYDAAFANDDGEHGRDTHREKDHIQGWGNFRVLK